MYVSVLPTTGFDGLAEIVATTSGGMPLPPPPPPPVVGAATTVGVAADSTGPTGPPPLSALTLTRIVEPMSPATGTYVDAVAEPMSAQFAPAASQRSHW